MNILYEEVSPVMASIAIILCLPYLLCFHALFIYEHKYAHATVLYVYGKQ